MITLFCLVGSSLAQPAFDWGEEDADSITWSAVPDDAWDEIPVDAIDSVPNQYLNILPFDQDFHPIQASPNIRIDNDEPFDLLEIDFFDG